MANCPPSGCFDNWADLGESDLCFSRKEGGINQAIIFKCGVQRSDIVDTYDTDSLDNAKIEALIASGDAKLIPGVQITINAPSELTAPSGNPCIGETAINYDRSLTWQDFNVNRNRNEFYNSINAAKGFPIGGLLLKHCADDMITYIEGDLKFNGGRQSPEQSSDAQFYEFNVTWRAKDMEEIFEQEIDAFGN
jgi:hypothetical protein